MCGICGKYYFNLNKRVEKSDLEEMTRVIANRGPDDEGYYIDKNIGLGFRRLSIIDLEGGHQPISNEDGSIWIVFNGEIYNYKFLFQSLIGKGHQFKSLSDTETIVHLYEEYGTECVKHLRGMFAFVLWDSKKRLLFGARDRFGIKPFFYYLDNKQFVFGSELKCILTEKDVNRDLSIEALDYYLTYGYSPSEISIYSHVKKLEPGHIMVIKEGCTPQISPYWKIMYTPDFSKTEEEWCELIETKLSETIKMHMISDVPLGAFLSGGVDSSSVVSLMAKNSRQPIKTFSIGFKEEAFNELKYAREIAKLYGTDHYEKIVEPESIGLLPKLVSMYDEPFADASAIPTYYVSKFAREFVTVVLTGDGGDELFAGYSKYEKMRNIQTYNFMSDRFNNVFWGGINKLLPNKMGGKGLTYYLSKPKNSILAYQSIWNLAEREKLYLKNYWEKVKISPAEKKKECFFSNRRDGDSLFEMQNLDIHTYMVDDILTKVDRVTMNNSLEARVPILDHEFAELTFSIPSSLKLNGKQKKYIFKKAMAKNLPPSILAHKKQGFGLPLNLWFKQDLKEYVHDKLLAKNSLLFNYFNYDFVLKIVKDHETGIRDLNFKIWALIFLEEWLNQKNI